MNIIFNEVPRQTFEIARILKIPEAAIWRISTEYMFERANLSFVVFLGKVFHLKRKFSYNLCFN